MTSSKSFYEPYILVGLFGLYAFYKNKKSEPVKIGKLEFCFATFLTICITLANYDILNITLSNGKVALCIALLKLAVLFYGIYMLFRNILVFLSTFEIRDFKGKKSRLISWLTFSDRRLFFVSFAIFFIINMLVLILCDLPATLSNDSLGSLLQITGEDVYSNGHPVLFTLFLGLFINAGLFLADSLSLGCFFFATFQVIVMSATLSFSVMSIYQITKNVYMSLAFLIFMLFLPLNLAYSHIIWKDIIFAYGTLVFMVSLYRYLSGYGSSLLNIFIMILGGFFCCAFRKNAFIPFLILALCLVVKFRKDKSLCATLIVILAISKVATGLAVGATGAADMDLIESLHIPMQQIARVISVDGRFNDEQSDLLSNVISFEQTKKEYVEDNADHVKNYIRSNGLGGSTYIEEHKLEFLKLYLDVGFRYPKVYLEAWISQTRGFWNAGYICPIRRFWNDTDLDVRNITLVPELSKIMDDYYTRFYTDNGFELFASNGVYMWLLICSLYASIKRQNNPIMLMCLGFLLIDATYLVATPLSSDFRYCYFIYLGAPFIYLLLFAKNYNIGNNSNMDNEIY